MGHGGGADAFEGFADQVQALAEAARRRGRADLMPADYELHEEPSLDRPVLLVALEGWIDAGFAAANAMTTILERHRRPGRWPPSTPTRCSTTAPAGPSCTSSTA